MPDFGIPVPDESSGIRFTPQPEPGPKVSARRGNPKIDGVRSHRTAPGSSTFRPCSVRHKKATEDNHERPPTRCRSATWSLA